MPSTSRQRKPRTDGEKRKPGRIATELAARPIGAYDCTMFDWSQCSAVERIPRKVSGAWLFKGTRVPVKALLENLEGGANVKEFLAWFPGVTREQVETVLHHAEHCAGSV